MSESPLPPAGQFHATERGVRMWKPAFTEVQVCTCKDGARWLTVTSPGAPEVSVRMDEQTAQHLAGLLLSGKVD